MDMKTLMMTVVLVSITILSIKVSLFLDWKWSAGRLESWEGLLLATDVSTTCAEAMLRVDSDDGFSTGCRKVHNQQQTLSRTPVTQMIIFNHGMLPLRSNHFRKSSSVQVLVGNDCCVSASVSILVLSVAYEQFVPSMFFFSFSGIFHWLCVVLLQDFGEFSCKTGHKWFPVSSSFWWKGG